MRLAALLLFCLHLSAVEDLPTPALTVPALDAGHRVLAEVLAAAVRPDGVDYAMVQQMRPTLDRYRAQLAAATDPAGRDERLAFYINAYNALTLALVAARLPADRALWPAWSITFIGPPPGSAWKGLRFVVAGTPRTLDEIEHAVLRPLGEPRIHVAINCASRSCPPLAAEPYRAATLDAQLAAAARVFATSPYHVRSADGTLQVNPILDWFGGDFAGVGGPRGFLRAYVTDSAMAAQLTGDGRLAFFPYDWRLNLAGAAP